MENVYLSSINFSIIIIGKLKTFFGVSRGLKQGYPLSLFLFMFVSDGLKNIT